MQTRREANICLYKKDKYLSNVYVRMTICKEVLETENNKHSLR